MEKKQADAVVTDVFEILVATSSLVTGSRSAALASWR
jgi:hypothetical protein